MKKLILYIALCFSFNALCQNQEYKNGTCTSGNCQNGEGVFAYDNGDRYAGTFANGKRNGKGKYIFENKDYYDVIWKDNRKEDPDGKYVSSTFTYRGGFKNDQRSGLGIMEFLIGDKKGQRYVGDFADNRAEGVCNYYFAENDHRIRYEGGFSNKMFNGEGTLYFRNGEKWSGMWKDDEFLGEETVYTYSDKLKKKLEEMDISIMLAEEMTGVPIQLMEDIVVSLDDTDIFSTIDNLDLPDETKIEIKNRIEKIDESYLKIKLFLEVPRIIGIKKYDIVRPISKIMCDILSYKNAGVSFSELSENAKKNTINEMLRTNYGISLNKDKKEKYNVTKEQEELVKGAASPFRKTIYKGFHNENIRKQKEKEAAERNAAKISKVANSVDIEQPHSGLNPVFDIP